MTALLDHKDISSALTMEVVDSLAIQDGMIGLMVVGNTRKYFAVKVPTGTSIPELFAIAGEKLEQARLEGFK
jgi:hypothetical protein